MRCGLGHLVIITGTISQYSFSDSISALSWRSTGHGIATEQSENHMPTVAVQRTEITSALCFINAFISIYRPCYAFNTPTLFFYRVFKKHRHNSTDNQCNAYRVIQYSNLQLPRITSFRFGQQSAYIISALKHLHLSYLLQC